MTAKVAKPAAGPVPQMASEAGVAMMLTSTAAIAETMAG